MLSRTLRFLPSVLLTASAGLLLGAEPPQPVSPGDAARLLGVAGACPTFSWGAAAGAGALRYELAVLELPEGFDLAAHDPDQVGLAQARLALKKELPGSASTWTPSLGQCLEPGRRYAWALRAHLPDSEGRVRESKWSEAHFFAVSAAPTSEELAQALAVLERYAAAQSTEPADLSKLPASAGASSGRELAASSANPAAPRGTFGSGPVAVRGEVTDASGPAVGVEGVSASSQGVGLRAVNQSGGFDLVLDGSEDSQADTFLSQSRLDRPSPSPQVFELTNSGGGEMSLLVDGDQVFTQGNDGPGSTLDADLLDGIQGAAYATDAELVAQIAGHNHDACYYTKTQLNTSGTGGAVHWNNLTGVPPGFADAVDDEGTTFTVGPGLTLVDGVLQLAQTTITTLDSAGNVGAYTSIAIGSDGLGIIGYWDFSNSDLKVAHCANRPCVPF